jgi:phytoene dehydrogenase-like protein
VLDALVIGAGPNGLTAAAYLARAGLEVRVLEAKDVPGGAVRSRELTEPGFVHDLGAGFFPFAEASPALRGLDLGGAGLRWLRAPIDSAHPALDGSCASIARSDPGGGSFGPDRRAWAEVAGWARAVRDRLLALLLATPIPIGAALRLGPINLLRLAEIGLSSGRGWSERRFDSEAARRVLPGLALHTDIGPDDACGAAVGFMLAALCASDGFAVPAGGTSAITRALLSRVTEAGGTLACATHVDQVVVRAGRAAAVRTAAGEEIEARAVVADVAAPTLYLGMLPSEAVPSRVLRAMRRFARGFGTFKVDWALDGPVPWLHEDCRRAAVVHAGESNDDLARFVRQVRAGELPDQPYLVIGQQSLADPSRAPAGKHTLWCYSRVPSARPWQDERETFADRIEARIEGLAPGFRKLVRARRIAAPPDLEATDENLLGGDLGGGSASITQQLIFRPVFPYFRYRTPVRGLYLCSSYTHPGAGVHGACGHNAASIVLRDLA